MYILNGGIEPAMSCFIVWKLSLLCQRIFVWNSVFAFKYLQDCIFLLFLLSSYLFNVSTVYKIKCSCLKICKLWNIVLFLKFKFL